MLSKEFKHIMQTDTVATAKSLLGMQLCLDGQVLGRIVETEAYLGAKDSACHSACGRRTPKTSLCTYLLDTGMSIKSTGIKC